MIYVLYNPLADNGKGRENAAGIEKIPNLGEVPYEDITRMNAAEFAKNAAPEDMVILSGGDGTLFHFANACGGTAPRHPVYYYPAGSGNDFMADVRAREGDALVLLNPYLKRLPTVTVGGQTHYFVNGVGYGIDGYCCEEGDRQRANGGGRISYPAIAVKGLLFHFKPRRATVTVDGQMRAYRHVWLAPTMNGRYYGGGMMVAPDQDRLREDGLVSVVVLHCPGKLKTLAVFPSIFKGEHVRHTEMVEVLAGREISVAFDRPTALQIDGETIPNVSSYSVRSASAEAEPSAEAV